jgi:hypothetical protein
MNNTSSKVVEETLTYNPLDREVALFLPADGTPVKISAHVFKSKSRYINDPTGKKDIEMLTTEGPAGGGNVKNMALIGAALKSYHNPNSTMHNIQLGFVDPKTNDFTAIKTGVISNTATADGGREALGVFVYPNTTEPKLDKSLTLPLNNEVLQTSLTYPNITAANVSSCIIPHPGDNETFSVIDMLKQE